LRLNRLFRLLLAALLFSALAGCKQDAEEPLDTTPSPFASIVEATPAGAAQPVEPLDSPLPAQDAPGAPLLERDPTPEPGTVTVRGELILNGQPAPGRTLYLAPIIHSEGEGREVAALDAVNDPRAESDRSGYFHFVKVVPGRYALGINSPIGPVLIKSGNTEIVIEAVEGQIVDLGDVHIVPFG
jgi:hypothetical protein